MRHIRFVIVAAALGAACGGGGDNGVGVGGGGGGGGGTLVHAKRVNATDALAFNPNAVTIPAHDSIFFTFATVQHNVVFDTQGAPPNVGTTSNATEKREFPTAGTFNYHCGIHPSMTGTVTVQ